MPANLRFLLFTVGLLAIWAVVIASAAVEAAPPTSLNENAKDKDGHCKNLCGKCGCLDFFCGEECICECNNERADTECIASMQNDARKLVVPYELLIQGPSSNRFVRNAFQFEQNQYVPNAARSKRATVVIYKPPTQNSLDVQQKTVKKQSAAADNRHKRSVSQQLDWFSDFANTLVRPAPWGGNGGSRRVQEPVRIADNAGGAQHKRSTEELDRSWFTDNTNMLLRPAPLFRRRGTTSNDKDESYESVNPINAVEQLPQVLKDTLRTIKETAISEDFGEALRSKLREGADVFQAKLQDNNFDFLPDNLRDNFEETLSNMRSSIFRKDDHVPDISTPKPAPDVPPRFMIPWFRPVRFLQRVQQAIN